MAEETKITVRGNITQDLEVKRTQNGKSVTNFTVCASKRQYNQQTQQWEDGDKLFIRVTAWGKLAENAAQSFKKGQRVIVYGTLEQRSWQDEQGKNHSSMEITADEVGASVLYHNVVRQNPQAAQQGASGTWQDQQYQQPPQQQYLQPEYDPWAGGGADNF